MSEDIIKQVKIGTFIVLVLCVAAYVYQYGRSVNQAYPSKTFAVDGEVKMETATDIATFRVSVVTEGGSDVSDIQKKNIEKMNTINAFLQEQGVEKKDLQTSQYTLSPRYSYAQCDGRSVCPPPAIVGYTLTQSLTVKVRNLEPLGNILSGIVEQGANTVSEVSFAVDDDEDARQKARTEAMKKAQKKAREIAKTGNFRLGKLVSLYEDQGMSPVYSGDRGMGGEVLMEKAVAPVIESGTESDTVRMILTYEIKN